MIWGLSSGQMGLLVWGGNKTNFQKPLNWGSEWLGNTGPGVYLLSMYCKALCFIKGNYVLSESCLCVSWIYFPADSVG